jgi:hypothetical protein
MRCNYCDGNHWVGSAQAVCFKNIRERGRLAGIEEGRAAERADVVAWFENHVHPTWASVRNGAHVGAAGKVVKS